jgi:HK97 gp10 family phage protein
MPDEDFDKTTQTRKAIYDGLKDAIGKLCLDIQTDAQLSIQQGPKTGRIYRDQAEVNFKTKAGKTVSFTAHKGGKKAHQASAPGEAPASDTGNLANSIDASIMEIRIAQLEGKVAVNAEYGPDLEFGTVKMAARPFLGPAAERADAVAEEVFADAINARLEEI